jgi:serine/threonine protein phosphatase PrpC
VSQSIEPEDPPQVDATPAAPPASEPATPVGTVDGDTPQAGGALTGESAEAGPVPPPTPPTPAPIDPTRRADRPVGPSLSFTFNLGKIPGQGEDSDPILRHGRELGLVGVFDGMGGAGGTVYETADGPRTGAYLASRIARDVVEQRMLELLDPEWNLDGPAVAQDLQSSVRDALVAHLAELKAPPSGLRSRLLRALPTTMALVALQRLQPDGDRWTAHLFWAGDSRAYVLQPSDGVQQLTVDDIRDHGDAMANLREDSVVSNAMSADTDFVVHHRQVDLTAPFLVVAATDGCFGYVPSPMHFEHLLLTALRESTTTDSWSTSVQSAVSAVTGDDAAMAVLGIGADFGGFQRLLAERAAEVERRFIRPLDAAQEQLRALQQQLESTRMEVQARQASLWATTRAVTSACSRPEAGGDVRAGDELNGYRLIEDFRVVGAGLSEWTFAERDGRVFFLKRFLSPTVPGRRRSRQPQDQGAQARPVRGLRGAPPRDPGRHGTADQLRRQSHRHAGLLPARRQVLQGDEKVDLAGLEPSDVASLGFASQLVLLKTVAHSLKILHDLEIVHSDLKPSNVMIKRTELGYTTKLIDFDSSYIVGSPPPPEDIVGTMNYYSPELVRYIQGAATPAELTQASDIFALGLIYTEYLTGAPPPLAAGQTNAAIAVLNGSVLAVAPDSAPPAVIALVNQMLLVDPTARPTVSQVHATLMGLRNPASTVGRAPLPAGSGRPPVRLRAGAVPAEAMRPRPAAVPGPLPARAAPPPSALRGKGLRLAAGAGAVPSAADPPPPGRGRALLGRLLTRLEDRGPR